MAIAKKGRMLNFRLRPDVASAIKLASEESGYSMTEILERLVDGYLADLSAELITEDKETRHREAKRILKGRGPIEGTLDEAKVERMIAKAVATAIRQSKK